VRLKSPKCTIGSAEQCTLRLRSRSVGRVHCLIVRGPNGTLVRRWSSDTRLNGSLFTDALLTPGDRLSIGGIDLEILATGDLSQQPKAESAEPTYAHSAELDAQRSRLDTLRHQLDTERRELDAERSALARERQRLETEQRTAKAQQEQWHVERAAAERQLRQEVEQPTTRAAELDTRAAELESRAADVESRAAALAAQGAELDIRRADVEARCAELDARFNELASRGTELAARTAALESRAADVESRAAELAAQGAELDRRAIELDAAAASLAAERTTLDKDRESWEADRAERAAEVDTRRDEPLAEVGLLEEEPEFETPKEAAPVDLAAVFRKIGANPVLPDDEPEEPRPAKFPMRGKVGVDEPATVRPAAEPQPANSKDDEDQGSIDDYMVQLLQRMRSPGGQRGASASRPAAGPPRPPAAAPVEPETEASDAALQALPPGRRKPAQMSPMAMAPETQGGLSAMRELANMSAQTALHRHARGQTKIAARGKLLVAAIGLLVGGLLLVLWLRWHAGPLAFVAALAGLAVGAFWGAQYAFLTGRLIVTKGRIKLALKPRTAKDQRPPRAETVPTAAVDPPAVDPPAGAAEPAPLSSPHEEIPTLP
jgi:hypothetical protein